MDHEKFINELVRDECLDGKPALKPYRDSKGILTIGIGRNLEDKGITREEAFTLCNNDIEDAEGELDHAAPWWRSLDEVRQRVLANMCFNMGITRLLKFHNMLGATQLQEWGKAADEMKSSAWYAQVGVRAIRLVQAMRTGIMPLLVLAALAACHTVVKKDIQIDEVDRTETAKTSEEEVTKTKTQDASDVDINTKRDENAVVVQEPDGTIQVAKVVPNRPLVFRPGARVIGTVPLTSVTTDQKKHLGATAETQNSDAKSKETGTTDKNVQVKGHDEEVQDVGPGWKFYAAGIAALLVLLACGYAYLKLVKKVVWL